MNKNGSKRVTDFKLLFGYKIFPGAPVPVEDTLKGFDDVRALHNNKEIPVD